MIIQTKKRIWVIAMIAVVLGTLFSAFIAFQLLVANDITDPLEFAIGCTLFVGVVLCFILSEIELFLSIRYFMFCTTQTDKVVHIVNKIRLIASLMVMLVDLAAIAIEVFDYADWEFVFYSSLYYGIGYILLKIVSFINWFYKSIKNRKHETM